MSNVSAEDSKSNFVPNSSDIEMTYISLDRTFKALSNDTIQVFSMF